MPAFSAGSDSAASATDTNNGHQLADALQAYAHLCAESDRLLRGLDEQLHELGTATAPIAARALTLVAAEGNITRSRDAVEELMLNVNASRKVGCVQACMARMEPARTHWDAWGLRFVRGACTV